MGNGVFNRRPGNLVKYNAFGRFGVEFECLCQMPGDGLPFAVFVACEPYFGVFGSAFQLTNYFLLVRCNLILRREMVGNVYAQSLFWEIADVAEAAADVVAVPKVPG